MFGFTIGEYKGEAVDSLVPGKKYFIQVLKRPGYYIIKEIFAGREYIYIDSGRVLDNWKIDRGVL